MADIELVIKIPEGLKKDFELEQWTALSCMIMKNALMNSTPLPKGHGDLIDSKDAIETLQIMFCRNGNLKNVCEQCILDCPTIIEADKGESK